MASATRPASSKLARMRRSRSRSSVFMGSAAPPYGRDGSPISCRRPHAARSPAKVSRQGRRNRPRPRRETPGARRRNRGKTVRPTRRARGVCRPYAPGRPSAPSGTTGRVCAGSRRGRRRPLADGRSDMAHLDVAGTQRDAECTMSDGASGQGNRRGNFCSSGPVLLADIPANAQRETRRRAGICLQGGRKSVGLSGGALEIHRFGLKISAFSERITGRKRSS